MLESLLWGLVASSSLLIGGIVALPVPVGRLALGVVMAFGAGVLPSAVSFELADVLTTVGFATAFAVSAFE